MKYGKILAYTLYYLCCIAIGISIGGMVAEFIIFVYEFFFKDIQGAMTISGIILAVVLSVWISVAMVQKNEPLWFFKYFKNLR